jgi:hypothetical protein
MASTWRSRNSGNKLKLWGVCGVCVGMGGGGGGGYGSLLGWVGGARWGALQHADQQRNHPHKGAAYTSAAKWRWQPRHRCHAGALPPGGAHPAPPRCPAGPAPAPPAPPRQTGRGAQSPAGASRCATAGWGGGGGGVAGGKAVGRCRQAGSSRSVHERPAAARLSVPHIRKRAGGSRAQLEAKDHRHSGPQAAAAGSRAQAPPSAPPRTWCPQISTITQCLRLASPSDSAVATASAGAARAGWRCSAGNLVRRCGVGAAHVYAQQCRAQRRLPAAMRGLLAACQAAAGRRAAHPSCRAA